MPSRREVRVKVVVQRYAYTRIIPRSVQNLNVLRAIHSDLADMHGQNPVRVEFSPQAERVPGLAEGESRHAINAQALVIDRRSGIAQSLLQIFGFEKGILGD